MTSVLRHPDLPQRIPGHAVLLGGPGSGKTQALLGLAREHPGASVFVSGVDALGALDPAEHDADGAGATARALTLLALALAALVPRLGTSTAPVRDVLGLPARGDTRRTIASARRRVVDGDAVLARSAEVLASLDALAPALQLWAPPLLLIDDLDLVPRKLRSVLAALVALQRWRVVIAARPAWPRWYGDDWPTVRIGRGTNSPEWRAFQTAVVEDRCPGVVGRLGDDRWREMIAMSGGSFPTLLQLASAGATAAGARTAWLRVGAAAAAIQRVQLRSLRCMSRGVGGEMERVLGEIRRQLLAEHGVIPGPVIIGVTATAEPGTRARLYRLVDAALHTGSLVGAEEAGADAGTLGEVEVHPLLMWTRDAPFWSAGNERPTHVARSDSTLLYSARRARARPVMAFVGGPRQPRVTPTRVDMRGVNASDRGRASLAVVSAASMVALEACDDPRDAALHLGRALGSGHERVFVHAGTALPRQLRLPDVLERYRSTSDLDRVVRGRSFPSAPIAVPGTVVWLGKESDPVLVGIRPTLAAARLTLSVQPWSSEPPDPEALAALLTAQVILLRSDAPADDLRVHFVAGLLQATPFAGYESVRLTRSGVVLSARDTSPRPVVTMDAAGLLEHVRTVAAQVAAWRRRRA